MDINAIQHLIFLHSILIPLCIVALQLLTQQAGGKTIVLWDWSRLHYFALIVFWTFAILCREKI